MKRTQEAKRMTERPRGIQYLASGQDIDGRGDISAYLSGVLGGAQTALCLY
jgi:hypothetical protein